MKGILVRTQDGAVMVPTLLTVEETRLNPHGSLLPDSRIQWVITGFTESLNREIARFDSPEQAHQALGTILVNATIGRPTDLYIPS